MSLASGYARGVPGNDCERINASYCSSVVCAIVLPQSATYVLRVSDRVASSGAGRQHDDSLKENDIIL